MLERTCSQPCFLWMEDEFAADPEESEVIDK